MARMSEARDRVSVVEVALLKGIPYQAAYNEILAGKHGHPERIGRRLFVRLQEIDRSKGVGR